MDPSFCRDQNEFPRLEFLRDLGLDLWMVFRVNIVDRNVINRQKFAGGSVEILGERVKGLLFQDLSFFEWKHVV